MHCKSITITARLIVYFWSRIDKITSPFGCWLWTGRHDKSGYGSINQRHVIGNIRAQRLSYLLHHGSIPDDKPWILHNCPGGDNPRCVNPDHLWAGTPADNIRDMIQKGRQNFRSHTFLPGDLHWAHLNKERMPRGDNNPARQHPERMPRGEGSVIAKLTNKDVREILAEYDNGIATRQQLAKRYNVSWPTIDAVVKRQTWRHIT